MDDAALLAKFLGEPESSDACLAYATWLEERHDPRGAYLRLLCSSDALHELDANDRYRRLFELRRKIDPAWSDQVDRTRIATHGVYQSESVKGASQYLRMFPDGSIRSVCSAQGAREIFEQLGTAKNDKAVGRGTFKIVGGELRFSLILEPPASAWDAWKAVFDKRLDEDIARDFDFIGADGAIRLHAKELAERLKRTDYAGAPSRQSLTLTWHKLLDDSRGVMRYQFATCKG